MLVHVRAALRCAVGIVYVVWRLVIAVLGGYAGCEALLCALGRPGVNFATWGRPAPALAARAGYKDLPWSPNVPGGFGTPSPER